MGQMALICPLKLALPSSQVPACQVIKRSLVKEAGKVQPSSSPVIHAEPPLPGAGTLLAAYKGDGLYTNRLELGS